ncbi:MAG: BrnT family toxin [Anaerolineae bacterium]
MFIDDIIWLKEIVDKLGRKHHITQAEVEEVFESAPLFLRGPRGKRIGENLYYALGQTEAGRYLTVTFILKKGHQALVLSACDMKDNERQRFLRK